MQRGPIRDGQCATWTNQRRTVCNVDQSETGNVPNGPIRDHIDFVFYLRKKLFLQAFDPSDVLGYGGRGVAEIRHFQSQLKDEVLMLSLDL